MDEKQKQIEEIAKVANFTAFDFRNGDVKSKTIYTAIAEALYNAGYRKIPEGSVVLTEEEYKKLTSCIKTEEEVRRIMQEQMSPMVKEMTAKVMDKHLDKASEKIRKQTVKEFAERLKEKLVEPHIYKSEPKIIDEIAKEFGVKPNFTNHTSEPDWN